MANNAESLRDLFRGGDTILSKSKLFESIRLWLEGKMPSPTRQPIQMALVAPLGIFSNIKSSRILPGGDFAIPWPGYQK